MASLALAMFLLLDRRDAMTDRALASRCEPFPLPEKPTITSRDVSIIIATINPESDFVRALSLWKDNDPKEIIVVTIDRDVKQVKDLIRLAGPEIETITKVTTLRNPDHRAQQSAGISIATGKMILLVDDDTYCTTSECIKYLLAPFETEDDVGGVGSCHYPDIPEARRNPDAVTPWEAISSRGLDLMNGAQKTRYGADGTMWTIVGRLMLFRTELIQNADFIKGFNSETFLGVPIKTGNDAFLAAWHRNQGKRLVLQCAPEAAITTTPTSDSKLIGQYIRWVRSAHQHFTTTLFYQPGLLTLVSIYPYMANGMVVRAFGFIISIAKFLTWIHTLQCNPFFGAFVAVFYLNEWMKEYSLWVPKYPWMAKYWWASLLWEWVGLFVIQVYCWATIRHEGWLTRDDSHDEVIEEIAEETKNGDHEKEE